MTRKLVALAIAGFLAGAIGLAFASGTAQVYSSPLNAGAVVGNCTGGDSGYEWRGPEGARFFTNEC